MNKFSYYITIHFILVIKIIIHVVISIQCTKRTLNVFVIVRWFLNKLHLLQKNSRQKNFRQKIVVIFAIILAFSFKFGQKINIMFEILVYHIFYY